MPFSGLISVIWYNAIGGGYVGLPVSMRFRTGQGDANSIAVKEIITRLRSMLDTECLELNHQGTSITIMAIV